MSKKYTINAATAVVIANMVGTGVFTSLGFQLLGIQDFASIILLWIAGGIVALCGAFAYSELGAALPRSGGEYNFLSKIYHPLLGFLSGWVSATIGFSAPIAAAGWALGKYLNTVYPAIPPTLAGAAVIIAATIVHSLSRNVGGKFQTAFTFLKVLLIIVFILSGLMAVGVDNITFLPTADTTSNLFSGGFATSLVFVSFAYSGWNASSYIAGEIDEPQRNIPLSILRGTSIVTLLYILLNVVFLKVAPVNEMKGEVEVAFIAAQHIFGGNGGKIISIMITLLLVSTISSMVIAGPRVMQSMSEDIPAFRAIAAKNKNDVPYIAIWVQTVIALIILFSSGFERIITYTTFVLTFFSTLTVLGVIILRFKSPGLPRPYKTFGYPFTPIIYVAINVWFLFFIAKLKTTETLIGAGIVATGILVYFLATYFSKLKTTPTVNQHP